MIRHYVILTPMQYRLSLSRANIMKIDCWEMEAENIIITVRIA